MKRRDFLTSLCISGITLLTGGTPARAVPMREYLRLTGEGPAIRFAVASDGHYGQRDTPFEQYHDDMVSWLNREHREHPLNFTLFNGDLVHDDVAFFPALKARFDQLTMPYYVSRGNHDQCSPETWRAAWQRELNYVFSIGDNYFIVLDTSNEKGDYLCPDHDWLRPELEKSRTFRNLFIFMHITPRKWTGAGTSCAKTTQLFARQKNLRAVFHGHDHDQDAFKTYKGKHYFFDSHIGGNWGTEYRGYRIVELTSTNDILTYQVNPLASIRVNSTTGF